MHECGVEVGIIVKGSRLSKVIFACITKHLVLFHRGISHPQHRDINKVQDKAQPSASQSSKERFELMMKTMEKLMEMMSLDNKTNTREHANFPPINQRRLAVPQIRQSNQRNKGDQQIRPPFQNNYVNENFDESFEDNIHCCDGDET
jgi:hypothetical protein